MDKKTALLYAQLKPYKALVNKTSGFIRWALKRVENPYVACSFGKDSAVMLHLIMQQTPDIKVRFIRWKFETEFIDNYDEVIAAWGKLNLDQIEFTRESLSDKRKDRYNTVGYDSYFIGLRKDESVARRITLKKHGMFYKNNADMIRISPLADWTEKDISAYMYANSLPILNTYLIQGSGSRTASRIPREDFGIRQSFLIDLKQRDFTSYQKLIIKFPEIIS
jgi:3'-phosphoadenosine 5'-phosphosulfate sulfotransferase (PAPS reductase)/FAD synthetase